MAALDESADFDVIDIIDDFVVDDDDYYDFHHAMTLTSSNNSTLTLAPEWGAGLYADITLENITIKGDQSVPIFLPLEQNVKVIIHSGTFENISFGITNVSSAREFTLRPTGDITITNCLSGFSIEPQPGYDLNVAINGVPVFIGSSGYQSADGAQSISIQVQEAFDPSAGNGKVTVGENEITYAWSYGGSITEEDGTFTITPYQATGVNYVIDTVVVDGEAQNVTDRNNPMEIRGAQSSVFATFAYTLDF